MSDGATGSAILVGNPASDPAAGTGGAAAAPTATPPATQPADGGNPPAPAPGNWYDGIQDTDLLGYVQNKGWKDPVELANGYRNLEKLLGGEKIPMPKGADDAEGWARVYEQLGRPKTAEEYKLPLPDGDDGAFSKTAANWMHKAGLNQQQAELISKEWNEYQAGILAQQQQQASQQSEADMQALRSEWGGAYDENIQMAKVAVREYGLDEAKLQAIESAIGTGEMMRLFAKIGRAQGEHNFESGGGGNQFGMTPQAAQQRIAALRQDQGWTAKYLANDADAVGEMKRLMSLAYPE